MLRIPAASCRRSAAARACRLILPQSGNLDRPVHEAFDLRRRHRPGGPGRFAAALEDRHRRDERIRKRSPSSGSASVFTLTTMKRPAFDAATLRVPARPYGRVRTTAPRSPLRPEARRHERARRMRRRRHLDGSAGGRQRGLASTTTGFATGEWQTVALSTGRTADNESAIVHWMSLIGLPRPRSMVTARPWGTASPTPPVHPARSAGSSGGGHGGPCCRRRQGSR